MRPAPPWMLTLMLVVGLAIILPVLIIGIWRGHWRRAILVSTMMAVVWGSGTAFYVKVGLPPYWTFMVLFYTVGPVILWWRWPHILTGLGMTQVRRAAKPPPQ